MIREDKAGVRESNTKEELCEAWVRQDKTKEKQSKTKEREGKTETGQSMARAILQRRKQGKTVCVGIALTLTFLLLTGCGAADGSANDTIFSPEISTNSSAAAGGASYESYDYGYDNYESELYEEELEESDGNITKEPDSASVLSDRKLIRTVNMDVETKEQDYDMFLATLQEEVQSLGGYIENMDSYNGSSYGGYRSSRNANLILRIPKERLDGFLNMVSGIANVVRRSESVDDVTLTYVDMASRRNALQTEQERLLKLLEQADTIEDILTIEGRLSDVRYQLESMESRLRTMDNQVDYSTVYLYVSEVRELTPVVEQTVWERISYGFVDSLEEIGDGAVDIFVWVLVNLPYLVLWIAFIAVVVIFIKKHWKKGKGEFKVKKGKKENKKNQEPPKHQDSENEKPDSDQNQGDSKA